MAQEGLDERIQEILERRGILDARHLSVARNEAADAGVRIEKHLVDKGIISTQDLTLVLSDYLHIPAIKLSVVIPNPAIIELLPKDLMARRLAIPLARVGNLLTVALADPFDVMTVDEIQSITGLTVMTVAAAENEVNDALARILAASSQGLDMTPFLNDADASVEIVDGSGAENQQSIDEMLEDAEGAPVIRLVNMILLEAMRTGASDVHVEPMERQMRLRYRIDGLLHERPAPPKKLQNAIISRIKILADLNIAERRIPQDGRFNIKALNKTVDLRVSLLPTTHGEKVVMRILDKTSLASNLSSLGLDNIAEQAMRHAIAQPHGIILVTGPTGSGKTTTLYSCLQELNRPEVNIITCEDPVEYQIQGINQVQINADVGLSFASSLRSILRQDPDIVLVGEIRDGETAEIAIKAALTGHLVLSTLHTNDAAGAVTRLVDMGVEPFMLGSCLILAQAQRLYRKLCLACRRPIVVAPAVLENNKIAPDFFNGHTVYAPVGCARCFAGYKGRGAIMEVMPMSEALRDAVVRGADAHELRRIGREGGMVTLVEAGLTRVRDGITSLDAALEVTGSD